MLRLRSLPHPRHASALSLELLQEGLVLVLHDRVRQLVLQAALVRLLRRRRRRGAVISSPAVRPGRLLPIAELVVGGEGKSRQGAAVERD